MSEEEILDKSGADEKPMLEAESKGSVAWGVGQVLLLHVLQLPVAAMTFGFSLAVIVREPVDLCHSCSHYCASEGTRRYGEGDYHRRVCDCAAEHRVHGLRLLQDSIALK